MNKSIMIFLFYTVGPLVCGVTIGCFINRYANNLIPFILQMLTVGLAITIGAKLIRKEIKNEQ